MYCKCSANNTKNHRKFSNVLKVIAVEIFKVTKWNRKNEIFTQSFIDHCKNIYAYMRISPLIVFVFRFSWHSTFSVCFFYFFLSTCFLIFAFASIHTIVAFTFEQRTTYFKQKRDSQSFVRRNKNFMIVYFVSFVPFVVLWLWFLYAVCCDTFLLSCVTSSVTTEKVTDCLIVSVSFYQFIEVEEKPQAIFTVLYLIVVMSMYLIADGILCNVNERFCVNILLAHLIVLVAYRAYWDKHLCPFLDIPNEQNAIWCKLKCVSMWFRTNYCVYLPFIW